MIAGAETRSIVASRPKGSSALTTSIVLVFAVALSSGPASLAARQAVVTAPPSDHASGRLIHLQAGSFDPTMGTLELPPQLRSAGAGAWEDYYVVQFHGAVLPAWRARVESLGGKLYGYMADHAYLVKLTRPMLRQVQRLPEVRWVGRYEPGYRISPRLFASLESDSELVVNVLVFEPEEAEQIANVVSAGSGEVIAHGRGAVVRALVQGRSLIHLAQLTGVAWIEEYVPHQLWNDKATAIVHADDVWSVPGLDGAGQTIAIADTGLDLGADDTTMHPDFADPVLGGNRIVGTQALGRTTWDDPDGHGTHVAGSAVGNGTQSSDVYAGVAPGASLYFQSVLDSNNGLGGIPADLNDLFADPYSAGARIHSNSWGAAVNGLYTTDSWNVDGYAWDHPDCAILFSAGNSGKDVTKDGVVDPDSLGSPGTAKNCITVGASENERPSLESYWGSNYGEPIASDRTADDPGGLAAFSSRGPTDDGRVKPDVVAPGTWVASTRSRVRAIDEGFEGGTLPSGWSAGSGWAVSSAAARTGSYCLANGTPGVSYANGLSSWVDLPPLDLRAYATGLTGWIEVAIWTKFSIESDGDRGWLVLDDQRPGQGWYGYSYYGTQADWALITLRVDPNRTLDWSVVRAALVLQTNSSQTGGPYYYLVDDVRVYSLVGYRPAEVGLSIDWSVVDESYQLMSGTSMATPLTAGGVALLRQHYVDDEGITPSAALLKATLVATATDLTPGQYGTDGTQEITGRPDRSQGWGRVDLKEAVAPTSPAAVLYWDVGTGLGQAATNVLSLQVTDTSVPLRVALVWTDPPTATPSVSPQLVNDLDLTVTDPSDGDHLPMAGAGDHLNNVETVDISVPDLGIYTITVEGHDINGPDQPYALVVYGAVETLPLLSVSVTPTGWPLGVMQSGAAKTSWTDTTPPQGGYFLATNDGSGTESLMIQVADSASWTAGSSPGPDVFVMGWGQTETQGTEPSYTVIAKSGVALVASLGSGETFAFDLQCAAPTSSADPAEQSIVVTLIAQP